MEEVSWGQWLVGIKPIESISAINKQGELNFHNIPVFYELFEIARALFGLAGLIVIFLNHQKLFKYIGTSLSLAPWFLFIFILGSLDLFNQNSRSGDNILLDWAFDSVEVMELLIAITVLLYVSINSKKIKLIARE